MIPSKAKDSVCVQNIEQLTPKMFRCFADLVYEQAGITLGPQKDSMVSSRVRKRLRRLGMTRFEEYYEYVCADTSGNELVELLNVISTNVTHFYREAEHFNFLHRLLEEWEAQGQHRFRIWCAASSTGEEPYTLAMTVSEALRDVSDVRILATDISTKVIQHAREGIYREKALSKVPKALKIKYLSSIRNTDTYQVRPPLKSMVTFARLNLVHAPYPMQGPFDVVFCRNVMIYFDNPMRVRLLEECWRLLKDGGYLMVGHAESLSGLLSNFRNIAPAVYRKG